MLLLSAIVPIAPKPQNPMETGSVRRIVISFAFVVLIDIENDL